MDVFRYRVFIQIVLKRTTCLPQVHVSLKHCESPLIGEELVTMVANQNASVWKGCYSFHLIRPNYLQYDKCNYFLISYQGIDWKATFMYAKSLNTMANVDDNMNFTHHLWVTKEKFDGYFQTVSIPFVEDLAWHGVTMQHNCHEQSVWQNLPTVMGWTGSIDDATVTFAGTNSTWFCPMDLWETPGTLTKTKQYESPVNGDCSSVQWNTFMDDEVLLENLTWRVDACLARDESVFSNFT